MAGFDLALSLRVLPSARERWVVNPKKGNMVIN
jgi:hypothetical protein